MPGVHAKLPPSAADRWMKCPGSVKLTEHLPESTSVYAELGTKAHEIAAWALESGKDPEELCDDPEMVLNVRRYISYVESVRLDYPNSQLFVEQQVSYDEYVPEGFGTSDVVIIAEPVLIIIDLKYGTGVRVYADNNAQLKVYALAVYQEFGLLYAFSEIQMHICQPRLDHYDKAVISLNELLSFGEEVRHAALLTTTENAPLCPGSKQCRWCKIRFTCRERYKNNLQSAYEDFSEPLPDPATLTDEEILSILPKLEDMKQWVQDVRKHAFRMAMGGRTIPGWKIVQGRMTRKWKATAVNELKEHKHYDNLTQRAMVGLTEARKYLTKEEINELTTQTHGKPYLAPEENTFKTYSKLQNAIDDFND